MDDLPLARAAALSGLAGATDAAALAALRRAAGDDDPRVAYAAVEAVKASWRAERSAERAPFYFPLFADALERRDLATAYAAAPALADSLFRSLGASDVLRKVYAALATPDDIEPMVEIVRALGEIRDTTAVPFLLEVALEGPHPTIRTAAAETLSERFGRGIDFEATGLAPPDFPAIDWDRLRAFGRRPALTFETDRGTVVIELDAEAAPVTVEAIVRNAEAGRYDGVPFHRVVPNFVVQGGDYVRADGFGGPGYFLPSEFARIPYERGTVGMASAGKDTEGSQYFVTHSVQPHLDGRYTAFGRVVQGQDVVDAIRQGDRVLRASVSSAAELESH
jgi:peptidylprolyl isomerase